MVKDLFSPIHIIVTGGTIDSYYDGRKDTAVPYKHSIIPGYLKSLNIEHKLKFTEVCMKDSRELGASDLKKIRSVIEKSPFKNFIITHGTYTMPDTARFLKASNSKKDAVVILTGAMIPMGMGNSDAPFNLGYTIAIIDSLKSGIYVCVNGKLFGPDKVMLLRHTGF